MVLSPPGITQSSGTAELLRSRNVQAVIKGNFVVLPCDLISEVPGEDFLEAWMAHQPALAENSVSSNGQALTSSLSDNVNQPGGLGVWYETSGEDSKGEEPDFLVTTPIDSSFVTQADRPGQRGLARLAYSTTTATIKDSMTDDEALPVRHSILAKYSRVKTFRTYRDAHIYVFPRWILDIVNHNSEMDSISEDLVGSWAKINWQTGLAERLGFNAALAHEAKRSSAPDVNLTSNDEQSKVVALASTGQCDIPVGGVKDIGERDFSSSSPSPPIFAYTYTANHNGPMLRRTDTSASILRVSLRLAKLDATEDVGLDKLSPLAHPRKISNPSGIAPKCTVTKADCLLADNVTVEEKCVIKESVLGANCHVKSGARLTRCVLMDGVTVGERCQLTGCVLGRKSQIGRESVLKDCEVQDGNQVPSKTESKGEKFTFFEALEGSEHPTSHEDSDASANDAPET
jgi:translation initiation factor eIF-2B subunit gamma